MRNQAGPLQAGPLTEAKVPVADHQRGFGHHRGLGARIPGLRRYAEDHLVRSSLLTMSSTVLTSLLGFVYWLVAARVAPASEVGYVSALMSGATAASLLTGLGASIYMLERLPGFERTGEWARFLTSWIWSTSLLSGVTAAILGVVFVRDAVDAVGTRWVLPVLVVSAICLTALGILDRAFMSARRADLGLLLAAGLAAGKVLSLGALVPAASESFAMLVGWAVVLLATCAVGMRVVAPWAGHGQVGAPTVPRPGRGAVLRVLGHHATSVSGIITPYLLPIMVVARMDAASNAYLYASWMVGSAFFIVSPSVAASLFSEASRDPATLGQRTRGALRLLMILLPLPILGAVLLGRIVLRIFGPAYASEGYVLLAILAVSAIPDALTNVAVALMRVKGLLRRSSALNAGMGAVALGGAWALMPTWGLIGVGVAWLVAQTLGALVVAPLIIGALRRAVRCERQDGS